ncbi:tetratricopeptide repeat-containing glycosyltransferase family 2 protein [Cohnella panacarvi]|uniref:tetratricopeptide repeat-containing glycosyltransferase family 2 protein n=1 Tax=Cohnella panacarvi TaxID=400776 RepID=UPI000478772C|nr:glycosyltransferase family 2 protein [Cohnella panacarvi]
MNNLVSLCMIVKNEEAFLDRCLKSMEKYVDEIVIVDTGSTDRTKEIARRFTDKIYDFAWINDFSAARNESLKHATGKWILVMDADEYMEENDIRGLRDSLATIEPTTRTLYQLPVRNFMGDQSNAAIVEAPVLRVFGNRMNIRFHRPIHEQPVPANGKAPDIVALPYRILHSGYLDTVIDAKDKHERNLSIFNEMKKTAALNAYDHCMIGQQLALMKKDDEAIQHLQIALDSGNNKAEWFRIVLFALLEIYMRQGKLLEAWHLIERYLQSYVQYPDIRCIRGIILQNLGFHELGKQEFIAAHMEAEKRAANNQVLSIANPEFGTRMPLWQLALTYERDQDLNQCMTYLTRLLMANNKDMSAWIKMVEILSLKEAASNIVRFLDKLLSVSESDAKMKTMGKIAISLGNKELAQHYFNRSPLSYSIADRLKYALLTDNLADFESIINTNTQEELEDTTVAKSVIWGAIAWARPDWLVRYRNRDSTDDIHRYLTFVDCVLFDQAVPSANEDFDRTVFETLTQLYLLKRWDVFDRLIERYATPSVINQLADFFLTKHYKEPALQFYQHLLDNGQLTEASCDRLAQLQHIEGDPEDALGFWAHAIELNPANPKLYIQYLAHCPDSERRAPIKTKLIERFPEYAELSLLKTL